MLQPHTFLESSRKDLSENVWVATLIVNRFRDKRQKHQHRRLNSYRGDYTYSIVCSVMLCISLIPKRTIDSSLPFANHAQLFSLLLIFVRVLDYSGSLFFKGRFSCITTHCIEEKIPTRTSGVGFGGTV